MLYYKSCLSILVLLTMKFENLNNSRCTKNHLKEKNASQFIHDGKAHIDSVIEDGVVYSHKGNDLITLRSTNGKVITMNNCIVACFVKTEKIKKQYSTREMSKYAINAYRELYNYLHEQYKTVGEKTDKI